MILIQHFFHLLNISEHIVGQHPIPLVKSDIMLAKQHSFISLHFLLQFPSYNFQFFTKPFLNLIYVFGLNLMTLLFIHKWQEIISGLFKHKTTKRQK